MPPLAGLGIVSACDLYMLAKSALIFVIREVTGGGTGDNPPAMDMAFGCSMLILSRATLEDSIAQWRLNEYSDLVSLDLRGSDLVDVVRGVMDVGARYVAYYAEQARLTLFSGSHIAFCDYSNTLARHQISSHGLIGGTHMCYSEWKDF